MNRLLCCLAALPLAACGASGGLYLPDQAPPKPGVLGSKDPRKTQPAQPPAAPAGDGTTSSNPTPTP
jgi:hypothetical protein